MKTEKKIQIISNRDGHRKFFAIELFAGAGGLALGLEQAGFESFGFD